ncbi:SpoIIE family protein phosphatase [Streptomyces sp. S07_1.15]|uniref:PP2C family protein-serine/threonine phosphatase n=1 Tax=Streptomyces sp. S07_1.15 TaxID=2873925 RepID=UPI001D1537E3|nr:SpoIIE family protein phosphatase [Streptomyces sp. S07_1.15]MCC3650197.1 SpoIIE family protein phosphatase [Streptomyces sp. S07_1.15]
MPSHVSAEHPAAQPPEPGTVESLISQAMRLRGEVDAVRRTTTAEPEDARLRWQRALCELAVHHLDDLGRRLGQLRDGPAAEPAGAAVSAGAAAGRVPLPAAPPEAPARRPAGRAGSAEWNLLTDEADWSGELYGLFARSPQEGPLSLDELPSWLVEEDQPLLTAIVTDCLVDGRPIDGEFRIVRADGVVRTVHMTGQPVLDTDGRTASMWAVLRDVTELRRSEREVRDSHEALLRRRQIARTEHRIAVELQEAVLPPWRETLRFPPATGGGPDLAAHYLPSATSALIGGDWYDALQLQDGGVLLSVGDLTGHGVAATSGMAMLLGALRGMALAGTEPGALMERLNQLLDTAAQPALGSALCCRYDPAGRALEWAQAGHPAPLLFRGGTGRALPRPEGVLLGATSGAAYGQAREPLEPGDVVVLHTDGLARRAAGLSDSPDGEPGGARRLLELAPRFCAARSARECVRVVVEEFGGTEREDDACVLVARIGGGEAERREPFRDVP